MDLRHSYRRACKEDARDLAELLEIAAEGIATWLWQQSAAPGQSPLDVGETRAAREDANFSYKNAVLAERDGVTAAMLLAYRLPEPDPAELAAIDELPPLLRPLCELEWQVPGSYYVNALAARPGFRGQGLGSGLLEIARDLAPEAGCDTLSVQVFEQNDGAVRLYRRHGYAIVDQRPIVAHSCYPYDSSVLLMTRTVAS
ncbi:MAG: GNAT family N-acetyltransferase [Kiloniellales bacterium]